MQRGDTDVVAQPTGGAMKIRGDYNTTDGSFEFRMERDDGVIAVCVIAPDMLRSDRDLRTVRRKRIRTPLAKSPPSRPELLQAVAYELAMAADMLAKEPRAS
jgi:hypothetical protein